MSKAFKNMGFVLLILILTAGFYWLIFMDRATKQGTIEFTMDLLGKKLLAMIPDDSAKTPVEAMYETFLEQAEQKKISPGNI